MECTNKTTIKCFGYCNEYKSVSLIIKPLISNIFNILEISKHNKSVIDTINDFVIYYCNINNYENESLDKTNGNLKLDLLYIGNFKKLNSDLFYNKKKFELLRRQVHKDGIQTIMDMIYFTLIRVKYTIDFVNYDYDLFEINEGVNIYVLIAKLKVNFEKLQNYRMIYIFHDSKVFYYLCTFV